MISAQPAAVGRDVARQRPARRVADARAVQPARLLRDRDAVPERHRDAHRQGRLPHPRSRRRLVSRDAADRGGCGHLAADARNNPGVSFIGCEPFINGVAKMLATIEGQSLSNVRLHAGDAFDVLRALPDGCASRINLLYPDPWPKRRQRKRRFVSEHSVAEFARLLKSGGVFRFASDIDDYTGWTLARVLPCPLFTWVAQGSQDWVNPWPGFTRTRYEEKAIREGRRSSYLTFIRNS